MRDRKREKGGGEKEGRREGIKKENYHLNETYFSLLEKYSANNKEKIYSRI